MTLKKYMKFHFCDWAVLTKRFATPPINFCDSGEMDDMQIAKLVMQVHANYVVIIDIKKKIKFS
jgi:hypothetical protein